MTIRSWRFLAMMANALFMSAAVAHLMELPSKMKYDPQLYVRLQHTLYPNFGLIGGIGEIIAVVTTLGLAYTMHRRHLPAFPLTAFAAGCLVAAHAAFWIFIQPVNQAFASWDLNAIPGNWTLWRNQWEYTHAVRAVLSIAALGALMISALRETPEAASQRLTVHRPAQAHL